MATATTRPALAAEPREIRGKHVAGLRRQGRLPGVVYGHGVDSTSVSVDTHDFELLRRRTGPNALVDLSIAGKESQPVLIHGVQIHPVTRRPLHVDLFLVRMTEELTVDVPLVPVGTSPAVVDEGGTLLHGVEAVRVKALPDRLPQSIEYSIDGLVDFDTTVHVSDLTIPSDVTLLTDPDEVVAKVQAPRVEIEEVPVAEEEEELAEGEEAAAAEGEAGAEAPSRGEAPSEETAEG
jgi:large subunit ribosomal protein L25